MKNFKDILTTILFVLFSFAAFAQPVKDVSSTLDLKKIPLGGRCEVGKSSCAQGSCRLIERFTDVNLCTTRGNTCKKDSECCSALCDKKSNKCMAKFICTTCVGMGKKIGKTTKCCDGLYPNKEKMCIPLLPIYSFKNLFKFLISDARADETPAQRMLRLKKVSTRQKANSVKSKMRQFGLSSEDSSSIYDMYIDKINDCNNLTCVNNIDTEFDKIIDLSDHVANQKSNLEQQLSALANSGADADQLNRARSILYSQFNDCFDALGGNSLEAMSTADAGQDSQSSESQSLIGNTQAVKTCTSSVAANAGNTITSSQMEYMNMMAALYGEDMNSAFLQGQDQSDMSLYDNMGDELPFVKKDFGAAKQAEGTAQDDLYFVDKLTTSDFKSCRINLFGDYLSKQNTDYFDVMFTFLGLDYVTSGLGVEDFININHWKKQLTAMEQNIENFNQASITPDTFDTYTDAIKTNLEEYFSKLSDAEVKIYSYLFFNGDVSAANKKVIIDYFMSDGQTGLTNTFNSYSKPSINSFNLFRIVRFETIKFKFFLYKLKGRLKRKSLQMTCRCVDTSGPTNGDTWLEEDVKDVYLKYCNNYGKYHAYIMNDSGRKDQIGRLSSKQKSTRQDDKTSKDYNLDGANTGARAQLSADSTSNNIEKTNALSSDQDLQAITNLDMVATPTSKYSKFVKIVNNQKVVTFEAETGLNAKGLGDGVKYQEFIRDMALMKIEALSEVASENLFSISSGLQKVFLFLRTFNWGYMKTRVEKFTYRRKMGCVKMIFSFFKQLIFGSKVQSSGFDTQFANGVPDLNYNGMYSSEVNKNKEHLLKSFDLRPYEICEKRHYRKKTYLCGKKFYYRCVRNHPQPNDLCNKKLPVGMCIKSAYLTKQDNEVSFVIDPFIPKGVALNSDANFTSNFTVKDITPSVEQSIKTGAGKFLEKEFFELIGQNSQNFNFEKSAFGAFTFKYLFHYPKKAKIARYMTQGLAPFFDRLIMKAMLMNMSIYNDLYDTSLFAIKMHESYVNVLKNQQLLDAQQMGFGGTQTQEFDTLTLEPAQFAAFSNSLPSFLAQKGALFDFSGDLKLNESLNKGQSSGNGLIKDFSSTLSESLGSYNERKSEQDYLKKYMESNGRSKELERLESKYKDQNDQYSQDGRFLASRYKDQSNFSQNSGDKFAGKSPNADSVKPTGLSKDEQDKKLGSSDILNNANSAKNKGKGLTKEYSKGEDTVYDLLKDKNEKSQKVGLGLLSTTANSLEGDINGDGVIDEQDKLLAGAMADFNGDGVIDAKDLAFLKDFDENGKISINDINIIKGGLRDLNGDGVIDEKDLKLLELKVSDTIDLDGLDKEDAQAFSFGSDGKIIKKSELISYFKKQGLSEKEATKLAEKEIKKSSMSLFNILTRRYIKSAYPRFIFVRKKLE